MVRFFGDFYKLAFFLKRPLFRSSKNVPENPVFSNNASFVIVFLFERESASRSPCQNNFKTKSVGISTGF
jgi:hypothetical protein